MRVNRMWVIAAALMALAGLGQLARAAEPAAKPNIIWIMADDLGIGDIGPYGQKKIKTPSLDRMAAEGMRFTSAYCGTSVCAPSRCSLMTGMHMGHAAIRANREIKPEGQKPLPAGTVTVAQLLQRAGYKTALVGKWGLGFPGSGAEPTKMGFDYFYGYNCQRQAHSYYPPHLWRNDEKVMLDGKTYSHDLMAEEALQWVRKQKDSPFFLYFSLTIPHAKWEVPDQGAYVSEQWPEVEKNFAAMITRMDKDIGRLLDLLKELNIDDRTLVIFVSDNGACEDSGQHKTEFFDSNGSFRGTKRGMYEGSLRVPAIARWPGRVKAGVNSDEPWAFWDFLPTAVELAGGSMPADLKTDGISFAPALFGKPMPQRECFYWELHEGPSKQAVRFGNWKAVRTAMNRPVELYDLVSDPGEQKDLAAEKPEIVARAEALLKSARVDSADFPLTLPQTRPAAKGKKK